MERRAERPAPRLSVGLMALVAATYFMVSGGPYGIEELVQRAGYRLALIVVVATPLFWSLPVSLLVGELGAALPEDGGYYAWVRRALGPFWGWQEAWLSLCAAVFDIGIYPALFAAYLARLWPATARAELVVRAAALAGCTAWNLRGARAVGRGAEILALALLGPFALFAALAFTRAGAADPPAVAGGGLFVGVTIAMWNTMGWDNASTIAGEVDRPQRSYPLAMLISVALVALTYAVPIAAARAAGIDPQTLSTGGWVEASRRVGGPLLGAAVAAGGLVSAVGMLTALLLSYSRLPMVLAADGLLPSRLASRGDRGQPTGSLLFCGALFSLSLALSFERLVLFDVLLYGLSLVLEFIALVVLRVREPALPRPFRVPGGAAGCAALGVGPTLLLAASLAASLDERVAGVRALWLGAALIALGPISYAFVRRARVNSAG